MRWRGGRRSSNVEDRRGRRTGGVPAKGGLGLVIVVLAAACFGVDPAIILNQALQTGGDAGPAGDDRLQQQGRGYVTPESFTHGTSAQRVRWFRRGLDDGTVAACDTFAAASL